MLRSKKHLAGILGIFLSISSGLTALEFSARVTPSLFVPVLTSSSLYSFGGGAFADVDLTYKSLLSFGPEGMLFMINGLNISYPAFVLGGGLNAGVSFYPASRLMLSAGLSGGAYESYWNSQSCGSLYGRAYAEASFRVTPEWNLSLTGGYMHLVNLTDFGGEPLAAGFLGGLTVEYRFDTAKVTGKVDAVLKQDESVFPLLYAIYKSNPVGTITIQNNETAEIMNVKVSFRAGDYTSSQYLCGTVKLLRKHMSVDVPLYADFSQQIQNFTEEGKIPGEVVIEYELLGKKRTSVCQVIVPVYNRNTFRWSDPAMLSAYVSPNAPEILELSKYLVGIARSQVRTGLSRELQFAMTMFEGMKVAGITYQASATTPYAQYHLDPTLLDYVQYPFQTLDFKTGDSDELAALYSALLESVGLKTAIIPLQNDIVVAFSLGIDAAHAQSMFNGFDNLLQIGDDIWIPVAMSFLKEGFINAWYGGVNEINSAAAAGQDVNIIPLEDAWQSYPPADVKGDMKNPQRPGEAAVAKEFNMDMARYISAEFGPRISALLDQIKNEGPSEKLYNSLGLLYIRAAMYPQAVAAYGKAADMGSVTAMVNMGNIAVLQKDFKTAKQWYEYALSKDPDSKGAKNGLERVLPELQQ